MLTSTSYVKLWLVFSSSELFLSCIVSSFDSDSIIEHSSRILEIIQKSADRMGKDIL